MNSRESNHGAGKCSFTGNDPEIGLDAAPFRLAGNGSGFAFGHSVGRTAKSNSQHSLHHGVHGARFDRAAAHCDDVAGLGFNTATNRRYRTAPCPHYCANAADNRRNAHGKNCGGRRAGSA